MDNKQLRAMIYDSLMEQLSAPKRKTPIVEAEFKHINRDEHKIKLAIKDVEKQARLKANRDKPLQYDQMSLNKIMLSKVLGREKLDRKHEDAWQKLKKEYNLKESIGEGLWANINAKKKRGEKSAPKG